MRKTSAIYFLVLFLFANSGIAVNVHYCRGKFSSIKFFANGTEACKCGKKTMKPGCCKNVTTLIKAVDDLDKASSLAVICPMNGLLITLPETRNEYPFSQAEIRQAGQLHPPPLLNSCPIFLLDKVFRI